MQNLLDFDIVIGESGKGAWEQDEVGDSRVIALVITGSGPDMARLEAYKLLARDAEGALDRMVRVGIVVEINTPKLLAAPFSLPGTVAPCGREECACPVFDYKLAMYGRVRPEAGFGDEHTEMYVVSIGRFFEHVYRVILLGAYHLVPCFVVEMSM